MGRAAAALLGDPVQALEAQRPPHVRVQAVPDPGDDRGHARAALGIHGVHDSRVLPAHLENDHESHGRGHQQGRDSECREDQQKQEDCVHILRNRVEYAHSRAILCHWIKGMKTRVLPRVKRMRVY